jgi:hypothetical protein
VGGYVILNPGKVYERLKSMVKNFKPTEAVATFIVKFTSFIDAEKL